MTMGAEVPSYRRVLTPLDGSALSALALPHAFALSALCGAQLTLLTVIDIDHVVEPSGHLASALDEAVDACLPMAAEAPSRDKNAIFIDEQWASARATALRHLATAAGRFSGAGEVHRAVAAGSPAETILQYASEHDTDLIIMCTHGRSGLRRLVNGSVADQLLRTSHLPVLLIRGWPQDAQK